MKTNWITLICLALPAVSLIACGGEQPASKPPEPVASAAPPASESAVPASSAAAAAPSAAPAVTAEAPAGKPVKETIGAISKIEVTSQGKKKLDFTKQADVDALLKAIGTDQVPSGPQRRCPDDWVIVMKDKEGKEQGNIGLCNAETLGPEFFSSKGDRKGITLADEAAVRKMLKIETKPATKPASSGSAAPTPASKK